MEIESNGPEIIAASNTMTTENGNHESTSTPGTSAKTSLLNTPPASSKLPTTLNATEKKSPEVSGSVPISIGKPLSSSSLSFNPLANPIVKQVATDLSGSPQLASSPGRFDAALLEEVDKQEEAGTPLHTEWTFYVDKAPPAGACLDDYTKNLRTIYTVSTIEGFWQVFNNIPFPSRLGSRYSFHLMRGTRKPIWEDPLCENGGCWKLKVGKQFTDTVWQELVLAAIGEQFNSCVMKEDSVIGISVSIRDRDDQFQIWNQDKEHVEGASVVEKVHTQLCPKVKFNATFYKAHKAHHKFEKDSRDKVKKHNGFAGGFNRDGNNKSYNRSNNSSGYLPKR